MRIPILSIALFGSLCLQTDAFPFVQPGRKSLSLKAREKYPPTVGDLTSPASSDDFIVANFEDTEVIDDLRNEICTQRSQEDDLEDICSAEAFKLSEEKFEDLLLTAAPEETLPKESLFNVTKHQLMGKLIVCVMIGSCLLLV